MRKHFRLVILCLSAIPLCAQWAFPPTSGVSGGSTNGAAYWTGTQLATTATGGAGTKCLISTNGGTPTLGSCAGTASSDWGLLSNPSQNLTISMTHFSSIFTLDATTGAINGFKYTDTASNTGTGILGWFTTANGSGMTPFQADNNGNGFKLTPAGVITTIGTGSYGPISGTTALFSSTLGVTGHVTFEGVTSTGASGTGALLFATAPTATNATLVTPTVASFVNATHSHQNAAGGGTLNAAAIAAGILPGSVGGSNNGFWQLSGPAGSLKTHTWPNQSIDFTTLTGVGLWTAGVPSVVSGTSTNCVHVDGTSGACGSGSGIVTMVTQAGPPTSACTAPGTGNLALSFDSTNSNLYYCNNATGPVWRQILDDGTGSGKTGVIAAAGLTSGVEGFTVNDVAGTSILYIMPTSNGASGQVLSDSGSATCPTLASSAPSTCHQLAWIAASGGGTVTTTGAFTANGLTMSTSTGGTVIQTITPVNNAVVVTNGSGVPSESTTLPSGITLVAPVLGTPASGTMTNVTGTATGLTSGITQALASATTTVNVSSATAPTSGQVLTATSGTAATWQTPTGGSGGGGGTVVTKAASCVMNSTCNGANDNGTWFVFTAASLTATLPASAPTMPWLIHLEARGNDLTISYNSLATSGSCVTTLKSGTNIDIASNTTLSGYDCGAGPAPVTGIRLGNGSAADTAAVVTNDVQTKNSIVPNTFGPGLRKANNGSVDTVGVADTDFKAVDAVGAATLSGGNATANWPDASTGCGGGPCSEFTLAPVNGTNITTNSPAGGPANMKAGKPYVFRIVEPGTTAVSVLAPSALNSFPKIATTEQPNAIIVYTCAWNSTTSSCDEISITSTGNGVCPTVSAPGNAAAGTLNVWCDSSGGNFQSIDSSGGKAGLAKAKTAVAGQPLLSFDPTTGLFTQAALAFSNLTGSATNSQLPGTGATTVNGQTCTLGAACTIPLSAINAQLATYQVLAGDFSNYKAITVASGTFTITLVASGSQPANGQYIDVVNYGSGTVTIARSGQNINGGTASLTLPPGSATAPTSSRVWSNGTDYFASKGGPQDKDCSGVGHVLSILNGLVACSADSGGTLTGNSVTSTTPVTASANSTSDQQLMELSLGAGYLNSIGQPFQAIAAGIYSTPTAGQTPTMEVKVKLCTVSGCGSGTVVTLIDITTTATTALASNAQWNLRADLLTASVGSSGTIEAHGILTVDLGANNTVADSPFADINTAASSSIDLTAALFVDFTVKFSTNSGVTANTITQRSGGIAPFAATAAPVTSISLNSGPALTGAVPLALFTTNPQTATYQVLASDFQACKTIPVASGTFTITLVASGSQPATGQCIRVLNYGSGTVTIARSGQNINGAAANLTISAGSASAPNGMWVVSSGTDYIAQPLGSGTSSGTVTNFSGPPQFSVANPTTTPAMTFPSLPNSYTMDVNSPYMQNFSIRKISAEISNSQGGLGNFGGGAVTVTGSQVYDAPTASFASINHIVVANNSAVGITDTTPNFPHRTGRTHGMILECMAAETVLTAIRTIPCGMTSTTLANSLGADVPGAFHMAYIVFSTTGVYTSGTDTTHYMFCTINGTTQNCTSTGVSADTSAHRFEVFEDIPNSRWCGAVDGTQVCSATDNPASGTNMAFMMGTFGIAAANGNFQLAYLHLTEDWK